MLNRLILLIICLPLLFQIPFHISQLLQYFCRHIEVIVQSPIIFLVLVIVFYLFLDFYFYFGLYLVFCFLILPISIPILLIIILVEMVDNTLDPFNCLLVEAQTMQLLH